MPISQVFLSNTFNEFRQTTNLVIDEINALTNGTGVLVVDGTTPLTGTFTIDGNLLVTGETTTVVSSTLSVQDNMIYLNYADGPFTITNVTNTGTAVTYTIDSEIENTDFQVGWTAVITGVNPSAYNISGLIDSIDTGANSFTILSTATGTYVNGGTVTAKASANVDLGWAGGYQTSPTDINTYAHAGIFRDATDGVFKIYEGYTLEPESQVNIDTTHSSFSYASVAGKTFTSNNVITDDVVADGNFVIGKLYNIVVEGTTVWTEVGATTGSVGEQFEATATGSASPGTGTAREAEYETTAITINSNFGDLVAQRTYIDFVFTDDNSNETPQVRIGAQVGDNDKNALGTVEEGHGAFVIYTNNADTGAGPAGASLVERMRVDHLGNVGFNEQTGTTAKMTWDASAESLNFDDNSKAIFGAGSDLQIYHDGSNSYVSDVGIGSLILRGTNLFLQNGDGSQDYITGSNGDAVNIKHAGSTKLTTTATGVDVTGNVTLESSDAGAGEGPEIFLHRNSASPAASDVIGVINFDGENSAGSQHTYGKIKGVIVDPTNASEDGKLVFQARGAGAGFSDIMTVASTGIDVTGTVTADGLTVESSDNATGAVTTLSNTNTSTDSNTVIGVLIFENNDVSAGAANAEIKGLSSGTNGQTDLYIRTGSSGTLYNRAKFDFSGDISFYEDTGTTPKFFWDASEERLKLGNTSPTTNLPDVDLHIASAVAAGPAGIRLINLQNSDASATVEILAGQYTRQGGKIVFGRENGGDWATASSADTYLAFETALNNTNNEAMRITSTGNVGIGTTNPNRGILHIEGSNYVLTNSGQSLGGIHIDANTAPVAGGYTNGISFGYTSGASAIVGVTSDASADADRQGLAFIVHNSSVGGADAIEAMRLNSDGNLGIGTSSPTFPLDVESTGVGSVIAARIHRTDGTSTLLRIGNSTSGSGASAPGFGSDGTSAVIYTDNAEVVRIDNSGNVGIGTSSPDSTARLHTSTSSATARTITESTNAAGYVGYRATNGSGYWEMQVDGANQGLRWLDDNTERMRIDASGNVGIGTSSPDTLMELVGDDPILTIRDADTSSSTATATIRFAESGAGGTLGNYWDVGYSPVNALTFGLNGSEVMRLDASGNLLVGKTATTRTDVGAVFGATVNRITLDGLEALELVRKTSDGDILHFFKENTQVGSIGALNSNAYFGNGAVTLLPFDSLNAVLPRGTAGAQRDAAIDLGNPTNRFKDLYLGGGVYLGGTGAANLLDDYEEGTWTPAWTFSTSGSATIVTQAARYTKIGNIVTVMFRGYTSAISSPAGNAKISGLPFTSSSLSTSTAGTIGEAYKFASDLPNIKCTVGSSSTTVDFPVNATNSATQNLLQGSDLSGGGTQNVLGFVITYEVA